MIVGALPLVSHFLCLHPGCAILVAMCFWKNCLIPLVLVLLPFYPKTVAVWVKGSHVQYPRFIVSAQKMLASYAYAFS